MVLDIIDRCLDTTIGAGFSEKRIKIQAAGFLRIKNIEAEYFK